MLWVHDFTHYLTGYQDAGCYGDPVVDATTVYTWFGRGDVLALDRESGALRWRNGDENTPPGTTHRPLALARGILVVGSSDGHLEGLVPQTGELLWTHDLESGSITDPIAYDATTVYVAPSGMAAAINPLSGEVLWSDGLGGRKQLSFEVFGPGGVDGHAFYIGGGGGLYAFRK